MSWKYPHIPNLITMRPNPRILLGQRLFWTEKKDGSCITIWMKAYHHYPQSQSRPIISSRNMETASQDLQSLVKGTEDYPKILKLLEAYPELVIYVEACRKGRSITGIEVYERDTLFLFDIYNSSSKKFLSYVNVHQHAFHFGIPVVKLYAETRHRSMKDLLKFKNHVLGYCEAMKVEGMVIKAYKIPDKIKVYYKEYRKGLIQAKVKLDIPEPTVRKIARGEPILPPMPNNEILGVIDKAWQDLGTEDFKDVSKAMPLIARYVSKECKRELYSKPKTKLFHLYKEYLGRMVKDE